MNSQQSVLVGHWQVTDVVMAGQYNLESRLQPVDSA